MKNMKANVEAGRFSFPSHKPMLCHENPVQYKYNPEACISSRCSDYNGVIVRSAVARIAAKLVKNTSPDHVAQLSAAYAPPTRILLTGMWTAVEC